MTRLSRAFLPLRPSRALTSLLGAVVLAAGIGCGDDDKDPVGPDADSVNSIISAVQLSGTGSTVVRGQLKQGARPAAGTGPAATITVPQNFIQGGSAQIPVTSSGAFSRVIIAIEGLDDYYELTLPTATTATSVVLTVEPTAPAGNRNLQVATGTEAAVGAYVTRPVNLLDVGTGELQISASWDAPSDVDLHVQTPGGEEIYYGNDEAGGGKLDLDSNAACSIDNKNNENITFAGTPPAGTYRVLLDYWDSCGVAATNWVVTVRRGSQVQTFTGRFTGEGTGGGEGDGQLVTTFTR
jgi:hypothetical protein